jgi:peptidoglycan/xylan/chitin deacetylase (PgdA/CDA1 family)
MLSQAKKLLRSSLLYGVDRVVPARVLVRRGRPNWRAVALTFDDGPHTLTRAYLDALDGFGVKATFFVNGEACEARPDDLADMARRGHELASHGFTHQAFPTLSDAYLRAGLERTARLLPPTNGQRPLVRPPRGALNLRSLLSCVRAGYTTVLWSLDSEDWLTPCADALVERLRPDRIRPGEIVLLHETFPSTLEALPPVIEGLLAARFELVTVGRLLAGGDARS